MHGLRGNDKRRFKQNRGQGRFHEYVSWLLVQEVSSLGVEARIPGVKVDRLYHLLSTLEQNVFYIVEWADEVVDIREQFPLLPLERTMDIASDLGVKHPVKPNGDKVMTTDFVVTTKRDGGLHDVVISCKYAADLDKDAVLQRLEIERRFFEVSGMNWSIATEHEIPQAQLENIRWVRPFSWKLPNRVERGELERLSVDLLARITDAPLIPLARVCRDMDDSLGLGLGTSLALARHLLATKRWRADFSQIIDPSIHSLSGLVEQSQATESSHD